MAQLIQNVDSGSYASRTGVSPIGTVSPNTGSTAATNSTYGQGAFASGINIQGAATAYTVQNTDYQGIIEFNGAAAITVTLNQGVGTNFATTILNLGSGAITLTPNGSLLVNGAASITLQPGVGVQVFFANRQWTAFAGATSVPVVPATTGAVAGKYLTGYDSTTGAFTVSTPAGLSVTITTAALTAGGTQGSQTFTNGVLTAQVQST